MSVHPSPPEGPEDPKVQPVTFPVQMLRLRQIKLDGGTQSRVGVDPQTVREYAEKLEWGAEFPPVVVFWDGTNYWLADGFHRWNAHKKAGVEFIAAEVRQGGPREALEYALQQNTTHGLKRSGADCRHAVLLMLADPTWSLFTDAEIARRTGTNPALVARHRRVMGYDSGFRVVKRSNGNYDYASAPRKGLGPQGVTSKNWNAVFGDRLVNAAKMFLRRAAAEAEETGQSQEEVEAAALAAARDAVKKKPRKPKVSRKNPPPDAVFDVEYRFGGKD